MGDSKAFRNVRVLDLTDGFAGALATMILGDNGATVVRPVITSASAARSEQDEPPGAWQWRRHSDLVEVELAAFAATVQALLDTSDVVVITAGSRAAVVLGIVNVVDAADTWRANRQRLVACAIDAFGDHPTLASAPVHDGVVHAAAGRMFDTGAAFRLGRPAYVAAPLAGYGASQAAVQGIVAALIDRDRTGAGQTVHASLVRALTIFDFWGPDGMPVGVGRPLDERGPTPAVGYTPAPTKDGKWLQWSNWAPHLVRAQLELLGLDDVLDDPAYAALSNLSPELAHALWGRVLDATALRTAAEWMDVLSSTGASGGEIIRTTIDGMDHPQVRYNGDVAVSHDPVLGSVEHLGPIVHVVDDASRSPGEPVRVVDDRAADVNTAVDATRRPLEGVILLEAAAMIATPIGSALLADLGARIIKIEPIGGEPGRTLPFIKTLQGKESIAVDIKAPEGREIVHRLAARADMFLHNYRPGVPERLGIDAGSLRAVNPQLLYLYVGGYGKHGPSEKMPAYHPVAGAVCGNAARQAGRGAITSVPDDMAARKAASLHLFVANEGHPDPVTGALAATALLVALAARQRTRVGCEMNTSMLCASAYLMSGEWIRFDGRPPSAEVDAELLGTHALDRLYETLDGWLFVGVDAGDAFTRLASVVAQHVVAASVLHDERFATVADRRANDAALTDVLVSSFAARSADDWERDLLAVGVGAVRADRGSFVSFQQREIAADRFALARRVATPGRGAHWRASAVVDMRGVDRVGGACLAGQHTRAILAELGYTTNEIDRLVAAGVVGVSEHTTSASDTSSTAEAASRFRALQTLHLEPPAFVDDWAVHLLAVEERERLRGPAGRDELETRRPTFAISGVGIGCLRFAEDEALAAIERGIDQYVVMGAGFDTFAMRHPELAGRVRVFEVDHPEVQALKRERLAAAPAFDLLPHFVPVDFETMSLTAQLQVSPFDASRPAIVSWMNTLPYLSVEAIASTLRELGLFLAPGSLLLCNYPCKDVPTSDVQRAVLRDMSVAVTARGEPFRSRYRPDEFVALLADHAFDVITHITEHDLNTRYFADRIDGFRAGVPARVVCAVRTGANP